MKKQPRKTRRQLQAARVAAAEKVIRSAKSVENPLLAVNEKYHSYMLKDERVLKLTCCRVKELSDIKLKWIFDLMDRNMKDMYKKSSWGWDEAKKHEQLTEDVFWYIIATVDETPVGFAQFRFDIDDDADVLYCYELQLEENFRRKGIGKFMMKALEAITYYCKIQKVILTVFKHNPMAISFFVSLGYKTDITSPSESQRMDYVILSKRC